MRSTIPYSLLININTMQKLLPILLLLGCTKSIKSTIVGNWYVKEAIVNNTTNSDIQGNIIKFTNEQIWIINRDTQILSGSWKTIYDNQGMIMDGNFVDLGQNILEISIPNSTKSIKLRGDINKKTITLKSKMGKHRNRIVLNKI
jgi:hypothetical protein